MDGFGRPGRILRTSSSVVLAAIEGEADISYADQRRVFITSA